MRRIRLFILLLLPVLIGFAWTYSYFCNYDFSIGGPHFYFEGDMSDGSACYTMTIYRSTPFNGWGADYSGYMDVGPPYANLPSRPIAQFGPFQIFAGTAKKNECFLGFTSPFWFLEGIVVLTTVLIWKRGRKKRSMQAFPVVKSETNDAMDKR